MFSVLTDQEGLPRIDGTAGCQVVDPQEFGKVHPVPSSNQIRAVSLFHAIGVCILK
jgi:hypothetical protein